MGKSKENKGAWVDDFNEQQVATEIRFYLPYFLKCFAYTTDIERTIQINRLLRDSYEHRKMFGHFQWHIMPRTIINRMGNILKAIGHFIAKFANVIKSNDPAKHANHRTEHSEQIAGINILSEREKQVNWEAQSVSKLSVFEIWIVHSQFVDANKRCTDTLLIWQRTAT